MTRPAGQLRFIDYFRDVLIEPYREICGDVESYQYLDETAIRQSILRDERLDIWNISYGRYLKGWAKDMFINHLRGGQNCPDESAFKRQQSSNPTLSVAARPGGTPTSQTAAIRAPSREPAAPQAEVGRPTIEIFNPDEHARRIDSQVSGLPPRPPQPAVAQAAPAVPSPIEAPSSSRTVSLSTQTRELPIDALQPTSMEEALHRFVERKSQGQPPAPAAGPPEDVQRALRERAAEIRRDDPLLEPITDASPLVAPPPPAAPQQPPPPAVSAPAAAGASPPPRRLPPPPPRPRAVASQQPSPASPLPASRARIGGYFADLGSPSPASPLPASRPVAAPSDAVAARETRILERSAQTENTPPPARMPQPPPTTTEELLPVEERLSEPPLTHQISSQLLSSNIGVAIGVGPPAEEARISAPPATEDIAPVAIQVVGGLVRDRLPEILEAFQKADNPSKLYNAWRDFRSLYLTIVNQIAEKTLFGDRFSGARFYVGAGFIDANTRSDVVMLVQYADRVLSDAAKSAEEKIKATRPLADRTLLFTQLGLIRDIHKEVLGLRDSINPCRPGDDPSALKESLARFRDAWQIFRDPISWSEMILLGMKDSSYLKPTYHKRLNKRLANVTIRRTGNPNEIPFDKTLTFMELTDRIIRLAASPLFRRVFKNIVLEFEWSENRLLVTSRSLSLRRFRKRKYGIRDVVSRLGGKWNVPRFILRALLSMAPRPIPWNPPIIWLVHPPTHFLKIYYDANVSEPRNGGPANGGPAEPIEDTRAFAQTAVLSVLSRPDGNNSQMSAPSSIGGLVTPPSVRAYGFVNATFYMPYYTFGQPLGATLLFSALQFNPVFSKL